MHGDVIKQKAFAPGHNHLPAYFFVAGFKFDAFGDIMARVAAEFFTFGSGK
jgi:hypothetical protein